MPDNLSTIVDCLRQLQVTDSRHTVAILAGGDRQRACIYLGGSGREPAVYAEAIQEPADNAVENPEPFTALGWNPPLPGDMHYYQVWRSASEADRLAIAHNLQDTFAQGYGIDASQPLAFSLQAN